MAQYEIISTPLLDAADTFFLLADGLSKIQQQLCGVLSSLPGSLSDFQQQVALECDTLDKLSSYANQLGQTLIEIIEVYAQAEQTALCGVGQVKQRPMTPLTLSPPIIRKTYGVFLSSDLILPDWLQSAVMKYEQSNIR